MLYEELNHKTENMVATEHAKVMRFLSQPQTLEQRSKQDWTPCSGPMAQATRINSNSPSKPWCRSTSHSASEGGALILRQ